MRLFYDGVDVSNDVSIATCWHDMYSTGRADEVLLQCNDTRRLWDAWGPKIGDKIAISDDSGVANSGEMIVYDVVPKSSLICIKALSIPLQASQEARWKSWEQVKLFQLISEIASRYSLSTQFFGIDDQLYEYVEQGGQSDFEFLAKRLAYEGASFLVYDGSLVVYNNCFIDSQAPDGTLAIYPGDDYKFSDDDDQIYGSCEITDGTTNGKFQCGASTKVLSVVLADRLSSEGEANRFAQGLLRHKNKDGRTMQLKTDSFLKNYAAGSIVEIEAQANASWDGTAFIEHLRHDYVHHRSQMWARQVITEY